MPPRRRPQSARLTPRSAARDVARDDEESWKRELRLALQGEMSAEPGSLDDLKRCQPKPEAFRVALTSPRSVVACLLAGVDPNTLVPREIPPSALPHPDRAYENRERENRERRRRALNDVRLRQLLARRSSLSDADVARHRRLLCGEDARDAAAAARRVERAAKMAAEDAETLEAVRQAERVARLAADELLEFAAAENRAHVETMGAALADRRAEAEDRGPRVTSGEKGEKKTETETAPMRSSEAPRTSPSPPRTSPSPRRTSPSPRRTSPSPPSTTPPPPRTPARLVANSFASDASPEPAVLASPMGDSLGRASRRRADAVAELERAERRAARSSEERRVSSRLFRAETRAEREKANASIAESSARVDAAETAVLSALDDAPRTTPREEKESASADGTVATPSFATPRRSGASALFSPGSPFATSVGHVRPSPRPRSAFASPSSDRAASKAHRETTRASLRAVERAERDAFETAANALIESKITSARETRAAAEAHRRAERVAAKTRRVVAAARRLELARERRDAEAEASAAAAEARVAAADVRRSIIDAEFADALERRAVAEANAQTRAAMARERRAAEEAERRAAIAKRLAARCAAAAAKVEAKFAAASDAARRAAEDAERNRAVNARAISEKEAQRAAEVEERLRETEMKAAAARARREAATRRLTFAEPTTRGGARGAFDGTLPETPEFQRRRAGIEGPGCVPVELVVSPGAY